ncbi:MAG: N-acetylornithine carbamoyltransferase [Cyclobacteriaceae bacterium]|nr:N-acetylornithine carbamoyltransferase [Cyclobacteriaceae bacterium]
MNKFFSVEDAQNPEALVTEALQLKANPRAFEHLGKNKSICLIFFNPSLRTRLSTQRAGELLGMNVTVFNIGKEGWQLEFADGVVMNGDKAEHIKDAARVIGAYFDIIGIRSFPSLADREKDYTEEVINAFYQYAGVPIVNMESATLHPLQSLADLITIREHQGVIERPKVVLTWAPHPRALPQSVGNSFAQWMNRADVELVITNPEGYDLAPEFAGDAYVTHDQKEAFEGADFIYAKNWSSYEQYGQILSQDSRWTVDAEKMALTNNGKFMHCLPVRRNVIVADEVIDSENSLIIDQAVNRVTAAHIVLKKMLEVQG